MTTLPLSTFEFGGAPEPMGPLTHVVISPANIAVEARLNRARPLNRFQLWRMKRQLKAVQRQVAIYSRGHEERVERFVELRESLRVLLDWKFQLAQQRQIDPDNKHLEAQWQELHQTALPLQQEYIPIRDHLRKWKELTLTAQDLHNRIVDNPLVIQRAKAEEKTFAIQREEARAYESLIIDRFTRLGYCYRWVDSRGNKRVEEVRFSEVHITLDAVFFKVAASYRTVFGAWKTQLPYGVRIGDLVNDQTLLELSFACQRQVTSSTSLTGGAWIIVHRLDTNDGLLNLVKYNAVMQSYPHRYHEKLPLCVGVGHHRQVQWLNLADYPHMLVAGFTGAGKSNCVNGFIINLISMHSPDEVRLMLVDLKDGLEFDNFGHVPHLYCPIVDNLPALADRLQELEAIMQERNKQMRGKAKRIDEYNAKYPDQKIPRLICIIDEVASIMGHGDVTKRINHSLHQLTAKGRAPGIHIILSTQRPSVDAIGGNIKVNLPARIVGRMPSHTDSLTVLGTGDAKELASVPGRMILQIGPDPIPVQTPLIEEEDVVAALKTAMEFENPAPLELPEDMNTSQEWTPEKLVALSLQFLGGNIAHSAIWNEVKEEGNITRNQVRDMLAKIWEMDCIEHEGKQYQVKRGGGKVRKLVEINELTDSPISPQSTGVELEGKSDGESTI